MKILLATDGSDFSRAAIEKGCAILKTSEEAQIRVISAAAAATPMAAEPFAVSADYYRELNDIARQQAAEFASEAENQIRGYFPDAEINLSTRVVLGQPAQAIIEEAEDWGADLIIVGSHGRGFWGRMLLGSVSNAVVHNAPCSVLVVRDQKART